LCAIALGADGEIDRGVCASARRHIDLLPNRKRVFARLDACFPAAGDGQRRESGKRGALE
jgi:hypothetical protein